MGGAVEDADLRDITARNHRIRINADPNDTKAGRVACCLLLIPAMH